MSPLRKQMQDAMELRGMALRTQQSYIDAVVGLAKYYRHSPEGLGAEEVERYLLHLIQERWTASIILAGQTTNILAGCRG